MKKQSKPGRTKKEPAKAISKYIPSKQSEGRSNTGSTLQIVDITDRRRAEETLLKAGHLQSAIFNSANFSSIATDAKGVIQIFNVGAERMLGYTAAEVLNKLFPCTALNATESLRSTREDQK